MIMKLETPHQWMRLDESFSYVVLDPLLGLWQINYLCVRTGHQI